MRFICWKCLSESSRFLSFSFLIFSRRACSCSSNAVYFSWRSFYSLWYFMLAEISSFGLYSLLMGFGWLPNGPWMEPAFVTFMIRVGLRLSPIPPVRFSNVCYRLEILGLKDCCLFDSSASLLRASYLLKSSYFLRFRLSILWSLSTPRGSMSLSTMTMALSWMTLRPQTSAVVERTCQLVC